MKLIKLIDRYKRFTPLLLIILYVVLIFRKFIFTGLLPIPVNLLMAFYFPFTFGGYEAYTKFVRYKGFLNSDVIRQGIPWKTLAFRQLEKLNIPFWNPYNFCGNPLLANFQSAVFYPLNIVFLIFPLHLGWSILEIIGLFLMLVFMYLYLREIRLEKTASLWGAMIFSSTQFIIVWLELNIIVHTLLWLPLALFAFERFKRKKQNRYILLFVFAVLMSILGGHPLSFIYVSLITFLYILVHSPSKNIFYKFFFSFALVGLLASFQLLPTIKFYRHSVAEGVSGKEGFDKLIIPWKNIITFLAPDYYGNEATWNKRGYGGTGDLTPFVGVVTLGLAPLAFCKKQERKQVYFFTGITLFGLLTAFNTPFNSLIKYLKIPILSSTAPARALVTSFFGLAVLSSYGLNLILKRKIKLKKVLLSIGIVFIAFSILFSLTLFWYLTADKPDVRSKLYTSLRNMVLPGGTLVLSLLSIIGFYKWRKKLFIYLVLLFNSLFFLYNYDKILTFGSEKFFFPKQNMINFLQKKDYWRVQGSSNGKIDTNFQIPYKLYTPIGYDILRIKEYAELADGAFNGRLDPSGAFSRADAIFPQEQTFFRQRFYNVAGVKYLTNKLEIVKSDWFPKILKFPEDKYQLVWQDGNFQVYERLDVYPRAYLVNNYVVENDAEKAVAKFYSKDFNPRETVILSGDVPELKLGEAIGSAEIVSYQPNKVVVATQSKTKSLLFLSDAYYPNWRAEINGEKVPIYRAHHAFRAVPVPAGENQVEFSYNAKEFYYGLYISGAVLAGLLLFTWNSYQQKRL